MLETGSGYAAEFLRIAALHLLAVASPGPDFALVLKQSIGRGRRVAIWTAAGIGSGIAVHCAVSILGLGLVLRGSPKAFRLLTYAGAVYLAWIGVKALCGRPAPVNGPVPDAKVTPPEGGDRTAWRTGLLTNVLNGKAAIFFVALFSVAVSPTTPKWVQTGYAVWMAAVTALWFTLVACVFTQARVRRAFLRCGHWFERGMGVLLITLAVRLVVAG